jgi:hypothetical protein
MERARERWRDERERQPQPESVQLISLKPERHDREALSLDASVKLRQET